MFDLRSRAGIVRRRDRGGRLGRRGRPASLPFTGLQLALLALAGVATLAGGALLRRAA